VSAHRRRPEGLAYHLTTVGSIFVMTVIVVLIAAILGTVFGNAFKAGSDVVPGRGVTVTPFPPATRPVTVAVTPGPR